MEALLNSLSTISDVPTNATDLLHPQPAHIQRLYKSILVRSFGIPEQAMQQPDLSWISTEMQKDPDLYSRAESPLLLCRFLQSILNDYVAIGDDVPQFGIGCLVDPKPRETRAYLVQLTTIAQLKKMARPYYDEELRSFDNQLEMIKREEDRAVELEAKLERLTTERAARLRLDENLCRQKEERASALEALTRTATETETRVEAAAEYLAKCTNTVVTKRAEEAAARRKCGELDYDLVDDPEALRERVEELRAHKIDQQRLQDTETREVTDLEQRDEQCKHAANTMNTLEGEMGVAAKTVARLTEALGEMHEKEAVLEELHELIASKKEGVEKKRKERGAFCARHEEERREQRARLDELSSRIADTRAECERLRSLEGSVKKSVLEQRAKLARLRNEKNAEISTLTDYVATRSGLLQKMESKMVEKQAMLLQLEAAYEEGLRSLSDAMTTSDLDVSVTATMTMQLLD